MGCAKGAKQNHLSHTLQSIWYTYQALIPVLLQRERGANPHFIEHAGCLFEKGLRFSLYFLNKFANACRASVGPDDDVSRSTTVRAANNPQSLRACLLTIRAVIGFRHSNRAPGSKKLHMRQV